MSESCNASQGLTSCPLAPALPFPKALQVSSICIRHARRVALCILSSPRPGRPADTMEMYELCLRRV